MDIRPKSVDAFILAGGINRIMLYEGYRPGFKALVEINGRPSVRYVLDALYASRYVRQVCIVGSRELLAAAASGTPAVFQPPEDNPLGSFLTGLKFFEDSALVLVATADLALLTAGITDAFIEACAVTPTTYPANLYLSVVRKERFTEVFAGVRKAINHFRDGIYAHGNLALVQPGILRNATAMDRVNAMYAARKSELRSALALGPAVGLAYVIGVHFLHALTLRQMAVIGSRRFRIGIVPVVIPHPEVAVDVDDPPDYQVVKRLLTASAAQDRASAVQGVDEPR